MSHRTIINVSAKNPPIVELDSEARAAYVRFSRKRVSETQVIAEGKRTITIDIDDRGEVIGVELIGVEEFGVSRLLKLAGMTAPETLLNQASYVPAKLQVA